MTALLTPDPSHHPRFSACIIILLLAVAALTLALAPLVMPPGYSWISQTTSESAAQALPGAWVARLGFLTFGLAVLWLSLACRPRWARGAVWMHLAFGLFMVGTAAFSHRSWIPDIAYDPIEDLLHSITATAMGFAFAFGVVFRILQGWSRSKRLGILNVLAVFSATFIPLLMVIWPDWVGAIQRLMFLVAMVWYGCESLSLYKSPLS